MAKTRKGSGQTSRSRLQLDFTAEAFERLDAMRDMAGVRTNAELIRNALRVYDWLLTERRRNDALTFVARKGDRTREVELFLTWP